MTTELEKQFFDTFGIEEGLQKLQFITKDRVMRMETYYGYPELTDTHYLELISAQLRVGIFTNVTFTPNNTHTTTIKGLQKLILGGSISCYETLLKNNFIEAAEDYKHQVQAIFKESEQE
jgi:hypothetical protein